MYSSSSLSLSGAPGLTMRRCDVAQSFRLQGADPFASSEQLQYMKVFRITCEAMAATSDRNME